MYRYALVRLLEVIGFQLTRKKTATESVFSSTDFLEAFPHHIGICTHLLIVHITVDHNSMTDVKPDVK